MKTKFSASALCGEMSSDDDKPMVVAFQRKQKVQKKKAPKNVESTPKPQRYSKFADMHAKEGKEGQTASEDEVSEDDKDKSDLSYITSDDKENDVSDDMHAIYLQSLSSQASQHGFGTPIFKKRAKERGSTRGPIFERIMSKHEGKRKKAANPSTTVSPTSLLPSVSTVLPLNLPPTVYPSPHRSSVKAVLSLTTSHVVVSPNLHRSSMTAALPLIPSTIVSPSGHRPVTCHQTLFEDNVGSKQKVNRMKLKTRLSFQPQDCDISLLLNDTSLHSETAKQIEKNSNDFTTEATSLVLSAKICDMSLNSEVFTDLAALNRHHTSAHYPTPRNIVMSLPKCFHVNLFCRVVHHKNSTINQSEVSKMFSREG
jgi:hypothetical protein